MAALISVYRLALGPYTVPWRLRRARPYMIPRSFKFFTSTHQGLGPHDHIYTSLLGPCAHSTQAPWPTQPRPLGAAQILHHAHGRLHQRLHITIGAPGSIVCAGRSHIGRVYRSNKGAPYFAHWDPGGV